MMRPCIGVWEPRGEELRGNTLAKSQEQSGPQDLGLGWSWRVLWGLWLEQQIFLPLLK